MNDTLIHYPVYIGDYLKNTMSFTQSERGAYMDICIAYIQNNGRLKDDESLYILTRCFSDENRTSVATVVERAFERKNGYIISKELNTLIDKQKKLRNQRIEAGKKSAQKRCKIQRALQQSESESESDIELELKKKKILKKENEFEAFWNEYGKIGNKQKALSAWKKIKGVNYEEIISGVRQYQAYSRANNTEQKYIKHASTWLNCRGWEDDYTVIASPKNLSKTERARIACGLAPRPDGQEETEEDYSLLFSNS